MDSWFQCVARGMGVLGTSGGEVKVSQSELVRLPGESLECQWLAVVDNG